MQKLQTEANLYIAAQGGKLRDAPSMVLYNGRSDRNSHSSKHQANGQTVINVNSHT
jgi:hypothetical protein